MTARNKTIKFISSLLIIFILVPAILLSIPKQAEALTTFDIPHTAVSSVNAGTSAGNLTVNSSSLGLKIKEAALEIGRQILMTIAKKFLQEMTKSTINWINNGFHGNPLYLENSDSFFKDIAKSEIKTFIDLIGYDRLRQPFGKDFALNTIGAYKKQFADNASYTLSNAIKDPVLLKSYREDFNTGGWNGFLINTQYPQNNYIGYQMVATEELARKLQGTVQTAAQKVQTTLQQGMGFLSPKICPSNSKYNNAKNEFQQPRWDQAEFEENWPGYVYEPTCEGKGTDECQEAWDDYNAKYDADLAKAKTDWEKDNTCPGGLVATTPGSVVANQVTNAMGSQFRKTELAGALGTSISAITDAFINHFMQKGLNALSSTVNPPSETSDNWDYFGNTLGSSSDSTRESWDSGPDEEIVLDKFKKGVDDDIDLTNRELKLIDNEELAAPGITQLMGSIWPKTRELDICIPGPDLGWIERLTKEMNRNAQKLQEKANQDDPEKAASAQLAYNELQYAVNFFKDWIDNKMLTELPNSVIYMDAVDEIKDLSQQSNELIDRRRAKTQALARLQSIKVSLAAFSIQPEPGSSEEKVLIALKKQYNAVRDTVSNIATVENTRNELALINEKLIRLNGLVTQCAGERQAAGWSNPGGWRSTFNNSSNEKALFCDIPIKGGFNHESFKGPDTARPRLPMVNARDVFSWPRFGGLLGTRRVNIELSCNIIFKSNPLDYKGNLPGLNTVFEPYEELPPDIDPSGGGGQCDDTGGQYADALRDAMEQVLDDNPDVANSPNTEENDREFLALVEDELQSRGFEADDEVLNGNNNPSTGDIIAIWMDGDDTMERYDAIIDGGAGNRSVASATTTQFTGFIPLNCTNSGGGNECGCATGGTGPTNPPTTPTPNPNPTSSAPYITSITPTTATPGVTTITINGDNLSTINKTSTATVQFYYGLSGRTTVDGTVNSAKTQVKVLVPAEINTTNTTIKIYRDGNTVSNPFQIQIDNTGGGPGTTTAAPSFNATTGHGGNLAYNPAKNNWLVVSALDIIGGRIMGNDGTAVTPEFKINTDTGIQVMSPKVAFAPSLNKYLVVWIGFDPGTIYGRFVNADGTLSGTSFPIFKDSGGGASFLYQNSVLQYDSKNKKFVFVWEYRHPSPDVYLITIRETGTVGTVVDIGTNTVGGSWSASLAVNEKLNEYCVAYDLRNSSQIGMRKFNVATGSVGTETILNTTGTNTSLVYNSVNDKYLLGWGAGAAVGSQAKILNSCNINDGGTVFTSNNAGQAQILAYNPKSNNYASIVQNQNDSGNTYNILSSSGAKLKTGVAFIGGFGNFGPVINPNLNDGTFGATSAIEYKTTRFAPNLGIKSGSTTGTPTVTAQADLGDGAFPDVVWYNNRFYVAYRSGGTSTTNSSTNMTINLYSFDNNLSNQRTQKIIPLNAGAGGFPRMTVSNNTLWLAYRDGEASGEDIKLWRQDTNTTESLGPGAGNDPVALGNGYIAWQKNATNFPVYRRNLTGGSEVFVKNGEPTGISRVLSNGTIKFISEDRNAVTWGLSAWFAGDLTVATDVTPQDDNGIVGRFNNSSATEFNIWPNQRAHNPHAATDGNGNYVVVTWNPTVRVAMIKK